MFHLACTAVEATVFCYVKGIKMYQFRTKSSETTAYLLCVVNISKDFTRGNMKKTKLNGYVNDFSVDYDSIDVDNVLNIHK